MDLKAYREFIKSFFREEEQELKPTAIRALTDRKFLNVELLSRTSRKVLDRNVGLVLNEVNRNRQKRAVGSSRKISVTQEDVVPVLRKHFCSLPPFCRAKSGGR